MDIIGESNNMPLIWEMAREKRRCKKVPKALLDFMGYVFFFWSREDGEILISSFCCAERIFGSFM